MNNWKYLVAYTGHYKEPRYEIFNDIFRASAAVTAYYQLMHKHDRLELYRMDTAAEKLEKIEEYYEE